MKKNVEEEKFDVFEDKFGNYTYEDLVRKLIEIHGKDTIREEFGDDTNIIAVMSGKGGVGSPW